MLPNSKEVEENISIATMFIISHSGAGISHLYTVDENEPLFQIPGNSIFLFLDTTRTSTTTATHTLREMLSVTFTCFSKR